MREGDKGDRTLEKVALGDGVSLNLNGLQSKGADIHSHPRKNKHRIRSNNLEGGRKKVEADQ